MASAISLPAHHTSAALAGSSQSVADTEYDAKLLSAADLEASVLYASNGEVACREAAAEESLLVAERDPDQSLSVISPIEQYQQGGLKIILRATPQLESFPQAKAAFIKAAAAWESVVQTPITVVIDVDFGATWFGQAFPERVIGLTHPQLLIGDPMYRTLQTRLLNTASTQHEADLYLSLPNFTVPTDLGETTAILAPSAVFRALSFINPEASPEGEPVNYGPPPAIGFNSNFSFDFDPSDGIDPDKVDFDGVVTHEIGHVLGFVSATGRRELDPSKPLAISIWDLFRLRLGASMSTFPTAQRILTSGGDQFFFAGETEWALSTGRPDGSGGDGRQASHWKDDSILKQRVGIMDPTIPAGKRQTITLNDLEALDLFGYKIKPVGNNAPAINSLAGDLNGDVLTLAGTATDADGDVVKAQLKLIDNKGKAIGETAPFAVDFGVPTTLRFAIPFADMSRFPSVVEVGLTLVDSRGNRSATVTADFTQGDKDGPKLSSANFKGDRLSVKGKRMTGNLQVEINGAIVAPPSAIEVSGKKLVIRGSVDQLKLQSGANRIRVLSNGLRSNILVADL